MNFIRKNFDTFLLFLLPSAACIYLLTLTTLPPYSSPMGELSNHYWGLLIDIARKWKTGEFSFWDRSIGGGFCLYSSGFYPLWAPGNIFAKFLDYDHFYIFKLIEPYLVGLFCMLLFLRRQLRLSYEMSCYGSLAYMGFVFTRHVGIIYHPFFLWACALFPLMLYFYCRLFDRPVYGTVAKCPDARHRRVNAETSSSDVAQVNEEITPQTGVLQQSLYLRAAVLGAVMAMVFLGGGAGQFAQLTIWSLVLLTLDALVFSSAGTVTKKLIRWGASCLIFLFFAFSLAGLQMIPTLYYTFLESNRTLGEYGINNFPIFKLEYKGNTSIVNLLERSFVFGGGFGERAYGAFLIFAVGKIVADWRSYREWGRQNKAVVNVGLTSILFFLIPPTAEFVSSLVPILKPLFSPLRMFTFGYCGFIIDVFLILILTVGLDMGRRENSSRHADGGKAIILLIFFILAEIYLFFPFWLSKGPLRAWLTPLIANREIYDIPVHFTQRYLAAAVLVIFALSLRRNAFVRWGVLMPALVFLGSQLLYVSYTYGNKGQKDPHSEELYHFHTPEHTYYRTMPHRYYMAYVDPQGKAYRYNTMFHNYDLLFGVHGINGFLNIAPRRFTAFIRTYHRNGDLTAHQPVYQFDLGATPAALTTHFPVEFTTVGKGMELPWPSFSKVVDGEKYDVWVREGPVERVKFANQIKVVPFPELITSFDRPYEGIIYMTEEDSARYHPKDPGAANLQECAYENFTVKKEDLWTFDASAPADVFVVLPEMYQDGWRLKIDGKSHPVFPANQIFLGFSLSPGEHRIELKYRPPFWELSLMASVLSMVLFAGILYQNRKKAV